MTTKHITNDPKGLVIESLKGLVTLNPKLKLNEQFKVVSRREISKNKVALVSGGGAGHEPSHAAMVGEGLLTAAISGNVFASPNTNQIRKALEIVENDKGTLMVIMQYTGDVLHFGLAKEQHIAKFPNSKTRLLFVGEDVSVGRDQGKMAGRRGLAGGLLSYKLAAALAEEGAEVDEVYDLAKFVAESTATIGMGLEHCHIPGTGESEDHLAEDKYELGMGIHNEPGFTTLPLSSTREIVTKMLTLATDTADADRAFVPFANDGQDEVVLFINNLGGMSELEMGGIVTNAMEVLKEKKIKVRRVQSGTYMTSLNMPGFSLSLLLLPREGGTFSTETILRLYDAPVSAPGWKPHTPGEPGVHVTEELEALEEEHKPSGSPVKPTSSKDFIAAIKQACEDVIVAEPLITKYDTIAGDGDCGLCLKAGADGILAAIAKNEIPDNDVVSAVLALAELMERDMDGTSGALYSIFWTGLSRALRTAASDLKSDTATAEVWAEALSQAKATLYNYTRARTPSRTLVDPLEAFVTAFASSPSSFASAVKIGVEAAAKTATYEAKAGRASYVGREKLEKAQVPDPGAHGVGVILEGILKVVG